MTETRLRSAVRVILVFLLFFMPYSTWALQTLRHSFETLGHPLPLLLQKAMIGWKEILLVVLMLLLVWLIAKERRLPFRLTLFDRYLAAFAVVGTIIGFIITHKLSWTVFGFRYDFSPFLYYFAARAAVVDRDQLMAMLKKLVWWSVPVMLFGLAQTLFLPMTFMQNFGYAWGGTGITGNPLPPYHLATASLQVVRAMSTFPGPNSLALYAVIVLLAVGTLKLFSKKWQLTLGALSLITLLATFSRGHLVGLACALLVFLVFWKVKKNKRYATAIVLIFLLVLTFAATMYAGRFQSSSKTSALLGLVLHDTSSTIHEDVRLQAWDVIKTHPFGTGLGTSGLATTNTGGTVSNPESWYIQMTVEFGWLGLLASLAVLVLACRLFSDMGDDLSDSTDRRLLYFFVAGFAAVAVGANFLPSWFEVGSLYWWILFGFFLSDYTGSFPRSKALTR